MLVLGVLLGSYTSAKLRRELKLSSAFDADLRGMFDAVRLPSDVRGGIDPVKTPRVFAVTA